MSGIIQSNCRGTAGLQMQKEREVLNAIFAAPDWDGVTVLDGK